MIGVLVVEDEIYVRKGIVLTVDWEKLGCTVVGEATNGEEGLEAAKRLKPGLIITDIKMPKMDGLKMLTELREAGIESAVVILTAYSDFSYAQQALRLGAADYLLKPFHDGELEQVVEKILSRNAAKDAGAEDSLPALHAKGTERSKYVTEAISCIASNYGDPDLSVGKIAKNLHISEGHLSHVFRRETGYTLVEYLAQYRIRTAAQMLKDVRMKIYEVAQAVGYRDIAYFSGTFRKFMGQTPSEYQNSH